MPRRKTLPVPEDHEKFCRFLGSRITELRKRNNWTREDCANRLHMTKAHLSQIEAGKRIPATKTFLEFLAIFRIDAVQFFLPYERTIQIENGHYRDPELERLNNLLRELEVLDRNDDPIRQKQNASKKLVP